jgi:Asp-tRNA(Asn)/Glu-tRNA(Gln) amidotransferase A subunit family amidase
VHKDWYRLYNELYHPRTAELIEEGQAINAETLKAAHKEAKYFRESIRTMMDLHGIDVWMAPSAAGFAPYGLDSTGDPVMNLPWTQAGLPVLGLPTGRAENGLPLGTGVRKN